MPEVIIPPDIKPETPARLELIDDQTFSFRPQFGRAWTQRNSYGDPRWRMKLRFRGLRAADKARMISALQNARGGYATVRVGPSQSIQGAFGTLASERLSNSDFKSGTSGWIGSNGALTVSNQVLRSTASATGGSWNINQTGISTEANYAPYSLRSFISDYPSYSGLSAGAALFSSIGYQSQSYGVARGYLSLAPPVNSNATFIAYPWIETTQTQKSADFADVSFASVTRCMVVDNSVNLLLQSQTLDNASWSKNEITVTANAIAAINNTTTAESLKETVTNAEHYINQAITVSTNPNDCSFTVYLRGGLTRTWAWLRIYDGTNSVTAFVNISTGAVGTISTGTNWTNTIVTTQDMGTSWYRVSLTSRKLGAPTTLWCFVGPASANGTSSYAGNTANGLYAFGTQFYSSEYAVWPARYVATAGTAINMNDQSSLQNGSAIYVKGLPASTSGLLVAGDFVEMNGELKQVTASLDSDAMGLGTLMIRPMIGRPPAGDSPIYFINPMGRFQIVDGLGYDAMFGSYGDFNLTLDEVYE